MDTLKIESYLEEVKERHEESECKLGEVREKIMESGHDSIHAEGWTEGPSGASGFAHSLLGPSVQVLEEVRGALIETQHTIDYISEELDRLRKQMNSVVLRQEELEDEIISLDIIFDSDESSDDSLGLGP